MPQRLSRSAPQQSNSAGVVLFKVAFLCVILMLIMALICALSPLTPQSSPVAGEEHGRPCVILDAGHGGEDGGAVCADGTTEKELNLAIVLRMGEFLRLQGVQVIYTRTQDVSLNVENIPGQHKRYDLKNRLKIAQKYPQAIFVSIHMNKFAQPQYGGAQVFYSVNHPDLSLIHI